VTRRFFLLMSGSVAVLTVVIGRWRDSRALAAPPPPIAPARGPLMDVTLNVNGQDHRLSLDPRTTLLDALRDHLGLTGSKKGCDLGQCGACTVLADGKRLNACLILAVAAGGRRVTTIEGLARGDELHPLQAAFVEHDAFQCGYCTPGQIMSAAGLLAEGAPLDDGAIRELMSGNICRCGAYTNIVAAIKDAASKVDQNAALHL
jgi:xanthine dehydrogenase YagT iron-sulfur-binding subunit